MLKTIKKYVMLESKTFTLLVLISMMIILVTTMFSNRIPMFFSWGNEAEQLLLSVSLSFFSSYIFYISLVHRKEIKDKENINFVLDRKISLALSSYKNELILFKQAANISKEIDQLDLNDFMLFSKLIGSNSHMNSTTFYLATHDSVNDTAEDILKRNAQKFERFVTELTPLYPFLDTGLLKILLLIQDSTYINNSLIKGLPLSKTFSNFHEHFYNFHSLILELKFYYENNFNK
ncbi:MULTISPECIES: hypothetical protein [Pseudoalteromonas]|uniref:hypothetical protein n=1 Tax=Pseudoalteromonas TaxID=53246 RepID=UPI00044E9C2B|nr:MULTISPECIES: hypothetical protein [Pseudoalteromonas]EWS96855.1 hypothetical protein BG00_18010 [Pseudoalteromonas sp. SCSIO_11900]MDN3407170.1 hypothetical protein [Pseudoalteromonas sp. APC 3218]MDN3410804.1 hypothetical protein [Pseudoalteromonas sp. APC 3894]MDN3418118.1 hypothetical protein [Pseudoalteromonas sp. APC 3227]MDN3421826.1 hypothetical protein [Pseudoalteromonas sp. APC 3895]|tara:strand:- start:388 stop:1089 length:702 start_codon:yes stop_codon:yes gene_type:complete